MQNPNLSLTARCSKYNWVFLDWGMGCNNFTYMGSCTRKLVMCYRKAVSKKSVAITKHFSLLSSGPTDVLPSIIAGPSNQSVDEGTDVTISCEIDGSPEPSVSWFYSDDILPMQNTSSVLITQSGLFSQLRITNVNISDQGVYRCVATSYIGTVSQEAELQVKSKYRVLIKRRDPGSSARILMSQYLATFN